MIYINKIKRKTINIIGITLILIISIWSIIYISTFDAEAANSTQIESLEQQIKANNTIINDYENIKNQLHTTAELIRKTNNYDKIFVDSLSKKWHDYNDAQIALIKINESTTSKIEKIKKEEELKRAAEAEKSKEKRVFLGYCTITHYCVQNYPHICNNGDATRTATGTVPTPGRTIAVDPRKIPYGSVVEISGVRYVAEDTGGAIKGNRIDICVATHSEALRKGRITNVPVYIIK